MATKATSISSSEASRVLTQAVLKAADLLGIKQNRLASIIGVSTSSITRMRQNSTVLDPRDKSWELATLFVRLFRGLDALMGSDDEASKKWLASYNAYLRGKPLELIVTTQGLVNVVAHVDAFRAKV